MCYDDSLQEQEKRQKGAEGRAERREQKGAANMSDVQSANRREIRRGSQQGADFTMNLWHFPQGVGG